MLRAFRFLLHIEACDFVSRLKALQKWHRSNDLGWVMRCAAGGERRTEAGGARLFVEANARRLGSRGILSSE